MPLIVRNIYTSTELPQNGAEITQVLASGSDVHIERIVSIAHSTPAGEWYDQDLDEWVLLLQGEARLELENEQMLFLGPGDYVFIPARTRHRVAGTSRSPAAIWLAIHGTIEF